VKLLRSAFDRGLDGVGCGSGAIGVVMNGIYGSVVVASRATSVWEVSWVRWKETEQSKSRRHGFASST
jgi:hypothetical protein